MTASATAVIVIKEIEEITIVTVIAAIEATAGVSRVSPKVAGLEKNVPRIQLITTLNRTMTLFLRALTINKTATWLSLRSGQNAMSLFEKTPTIAVLTLTPWLPRRRVNHGDLTLVAQFTWQEIDRYFRPIDC